MYPTIRIAREDDLQCPPEFYDVVQNLLKTGIEIRRVMECELADLMNLKLQISAKEMAKESVRMNLAYVDGYIQAYSNLLNGDFTRPVVSNPDVKPEEV